MSTSYYFPIDFSKKYRTYIKAHGSLGLLWKKGGKEIPRQEMEALPFHLQNRTDLMPALDDIDKTSKYLVVGLPAAGFTLPLYAEENKEESFMVTAKSLGLSEEEARCMEQGEPRI